MADIFISYAREDQERIDGLVSAFEQQGLSVFWDRRIPSGQTWRSYIGKSLDNARCVIVAWSRHSVDSNWVAEEADDGKRRGILVPILLDPVEQPRGFREIQVADLTDWQPGESSQRFDDLIKDIRSLLNNSSDTSSSLPTTQSKSENHIVEHTPKVRSKLVIFAASGLILVLGGVAVGYLGFKGPATGIPVSIPTPVLESKPAVIPDEKPSEVQTVPSPIVERDTVPDRTPIEQPAEFNLRAVIDDPDGYVNVRKKKSVSSAIATVVHKDEEFYTHVQDGNWWQVRTKDGTFGYMHVSRIRILK